MHFVLGSASKQRLKLLHMLGIVPDEVVPADIDETPRKREVPSHYAKRMAQEKLDKLVILYPQSVILTADTVAACGRTILPKAQTREDILYCLQHISGRAHRVYTAIACTKESHRQVKLAQTRVLLKRLSEKEMHFYANNLLGQGCAGGYAIRESLFPAFVKKIIGNESTISGLPLFETAALLHGLGVALSFR